MSTENRNILDDKKKVDLAIPGSWGHVHFIHESVAIASHAIDRAIAAEGQIESLQKENKQLKEEFKKYIDDVNPELSSFLFPKKVGETIL